MGINGSLPTQRLAERECCFPSFAYIVSLETFRRIGTSSRVSCLSKVCASTGKWPFVVRRQGILRTLTDACEEFRRHDHLSRLMGGSLRLPDEFERPQLRSIV